jgi:predicted ABC-type ATPase
MPESASAIKRIRMFAGPNGSGKSSLADRLTREGLFPLYRFINADELFNALQDGSGVNLDFLDQSSIKARIRSSLLAGGRLAAGHEF